MVQTKKQWNLLSRLRSVFFILRLFQHHDFNDLSMQTALAYLIAARRCEIDEFKKLDRTCELVRAISECVQNLQRERGVSNMYRTMKGLPFSIDLDECRRLTDTSRQKVLILLEQIEPNKSIAGGSRLFTRIAFVLHAMDELLAIRQSVSGQCDLALTATERYSRLIKTMLALVFEVADVAVDPEISRLLIALFNLMQGKEYAGQERALVAGAFASGTLGTEQLSLINDLIDQQEQSFTRFEAFCGSLIQDQWHALQSTMPLAEIERMRRKLLMLKLTPDRELAKSWFQSCSQRIDDLFLVERHVTAELQKICQLRIQATTSELDDQQALLNKLSKMEVPVSSSVLLSGRTVSSEPQQSVEVQTVQARLELDLYETFQEQSRHLQAISEELAQARVALDERKSIERAKGLLMSHLSLSEEAAYRYLRDKAMSQNRRLVDIADSVLSMSDVFSKKK